MTDQSKPVSARNAFLSRIAICVDQSTDRQMSGRIYSYYLRRCVPFSCLEEVLLLGDQLFNWLAYPQPSLDLRSFRTRSGKSRRKKETCMLKKELPPVSSEAVSFPAGEKGTFVVQLMFRQNATWQGSIRWVEAGKSQNFRSMLEPIYLIRDALGTDATIQWE